MGGGGSGGWGRAGQNGRGRRGGVVTGVVRRRRRWRDGNLLVACRRGRDKVRYEIDLPDIKPQTSAITLSILAF